MALGSAGPIPQEAIDYLQAKKLKVGFDYRDVWREEHAGAFTVAKMGELDMLSDMRDSLSGALAKGQTFRSWSKQVTPELQKRGWWGVQEATDPLTGERGLVQLGSPRRLKTIYDANLRTARQAGAWERIQRTKSTHPYLLYLLGPSAHHRPQHAAWSGTLLPIEDEFWQYAMPPNGYGCKCFTRQVSRTEYGRLRDKGYQDPLAPAQLNPETGLPTGHREQRLIAVKPQAPALRYRTWTNKRTGEIERVVDGIDPGWDTNPGQAARRQSEARQFMQSVSRAPAAAGAEAMAQVMPVIQGDLQNAYGEWVDTIAGGALDGIGGQRTIGALSPSTVQAMKRKAGVTPGTAGLTIEQPVVRAMLDEAHQGTAAISASQVRHLVHYLASPTAVIWDSRGETPSLLYVLEHEGPHALPGHVAVRIDMAQDHAGINAIHSSRRVDAASLQQPGMVRLDEGGAL